MTQTAFTLFGWSAAVSYCFSHSLSCSHSLDSCKSEQTTNYNIFILSLFFPHSLSFLFVFLFFRFSFFSSSSFSLFPLYFQILIFPSHIIETIAQCSFCFGCSLFCALRFLTRDDESLTNNGANSLDSSVVDGRRGRWFYVVPHKLNVVKDLRIASCSQSPPQRPVN